MSDSDDNFNGFLYFYDSLHNLIHLFLLLIEHHQIPNRESKKDKKSHFFVVRNCHLDHRETIPIYLPD